MSLYRCLCWIAAAVVLAAGSSVPAQTLENAGFEDPVIGPPGYEYNPLNIWAFSGQSGIAATGSPLMQGLSGAPEGNQVAFLQSRDNTGPTGPVGSIVQGVGQIHQGNAYTVTFSAANRATGDPMTFWVMMGNTIVGSYSNLGTTFQDYTTEPFTVPDRILTVGFWGRPNAGDAMAFIDNVRVNEVAGAIPEPGSLALLAAGLIPLLAKRRRSSQ